MATSTATNVALTIGGKMVIVKGKVVRLPASATSSNPSTTYAPSKST